MKKKARLKFNQQHFRGVFSGQMKQKLNYLSVMKKGEAFNLKNTFTTLKLGGRSIRLSGSFGGGLVQEGGSSQNSEAKPQYQSES